MTETPIRSLRWTGESKRKSLEVIFDDGKTMLIFYDEAWRGYFFSAPAIGRLRRGGHLIFKHGDRYCRLFGLLWLVVYEAVLCGGGSLVLLPLSACNIGVCARVRLQAWLRWKRYAFAKFFFKLLDPRTREWIEEKEALNYFDEPVTSNAEFWKRAFLRFAAVALVTSFWCAAVASTGLNAYMAIAGALLSGLHLGPWYKDINKKWTKKKGEKSR